MYPFQLEVKNTPDSWVLHLKFDSDCRLRTKLYDRRDDLSLPIGNSISKQKLSYLFSKWSIYLSVCSYISELAFIQRKSLAFTILSLVSVIFEFPIMISLLVGYMKTVILMVKLKSFEKKNSRLICHMKHLWKPFPQIYPFQCLSI